MLTTRARFEGESKVFDATPTVVAAVNSQAILLADRFVYSPGEDFNCILDRRICPGEEFLDHLRSKITNQSAETDSAQ